MNWTTLTTLFIGIVLGVTIGGVMAEPATPASSTTSPTKELDWLGQQSAPNADMPSRVATLEAQIKMLEQRLAAIESGEGKYITIPSRP